MSYQWRLFGSSPSLSRRLQVTRCGRRTSVPQKPSPSSFGTRTALVINDYWQAAIEAGARHLHLGQEDLVDADVPAIRRAGLTLGLSTHDEEELETALRHDPDYVALGPIYPTTLKAMRFAPQGLERIGIWKKRIGGVPLVAIGRITLERAPGVFGAGADLIAVVSDVTQNADPDRRVRGWLRFSPVSPAIPPR